MELARVVAGLDSDNDGRLNYEELVAFFKVG